MQYGTAFWAAQAICTSYLTSTAHPASGGALSGGRGAVKGIAAAASRAKAVPISQRCFRAVLNPRAVFGEIEADEVGDARAVADGDRWLMREASSVDLRSRPRCARAARNRTKRALGNTETVMPSPSWTGLEGEG